MAIPPIKPIKTFAEQAHQKWVKHFNANILNLHNSKNWDDHISYVKTSSDFWDIDTNFFDEIDQRLLADARRRGDLKEVAAIKRELDKIV